MRLTIISDTHLPTRAKDLPTEVWESIDAADVVIHAGDWMTPALLDQLESRASRLIGVYGNNDGPELRRRLPEVATVNLEGLRLGVVHETGGKAGREIRAQRAYPDVDVLIFGHSHIPWDSLAPNGMRLLNPGSPTDRRREPVCTYMTADIDNAALRNVTLHRLSAK